MKQPESFWNGKTVLVTGHTGFKGGWLSLWLHQMGATVIGYALDPPTIPSLFFDAKISQDVVDVRGDIRDLIFLQRTVHQYQPEIIIHMAAQPLVRASYRNPVDTYSVNVMGTVHVLEVARKEECVRAVVNVTTDKCYENKEWAWGYRENESLGGHDPYSSSKACAELATASYRRAFFLQDMNRQLGIATARAGNVIGGGDWAEERLIPDLIKHCVNHQTIKLRNPCATRPWQHVLEPLQGYLLLAQGLYENASAYAEAWNFGPKEEDTQTVAYIAEKILTSWGIDSMWQQERNMMMHEARFLRLDCSKARAKLGWSPKWDLDQALNATIKWYQNYYRQSVSVREYTLEQLNFYLSNSFVMK